MQCIFGKSNRQYVHLPKMSSLLQLVAEKYASFSLVWAGSILKDPIQTKKVLSVEIIGPKSAHSVSCKWHLAGHFGEMAIFHRALSKYLMANISTSRTCLLQGQSKFYLSKYWPLHSISLIRKL